MLNRRVDLHAIDAAPARWRGDAGSSALDGISTAASSSKSPDALVDFHTGRSGQEARKKSRGRQKVIKTNDNDWVGICVEINQCVGCTRYQDERGRKFDLHTGRHQRSRRVRAENRSS